MQLTLEQNVIAASPELDRPREAGGRRIGVFGKLFGCWHKNMSRPFTTYNGSYRSCLECGARRMFDTQSFRTVGPYFFPPSTKL